MSNSTATPDSPTGSPPSPAGKKSPPPPETSSSPAPPTSSNPTPPQEDDSPTPSPPKSPPPSSPPPSSPPPSPPPQSPPPSSPPPSPPPQSPPPNSPSPGSGNPNSSPPPISNLSPPPQGTSSSPPPSPSTQEPPENSSPPPTPSLLNPPQTETPPSPQVTNPPPVEYQPPVSGQFLPPPDSEGGTIPSTPIQPLSPLPISPPTGIVFPITPSSPSTDTPPTVNPSTTHTSSSTPSHHGSSLSTPTDDTSSSKSVDVKVIGGSVAGVVIIGFIALLFLVTRRRKRRSVYATHYIPPNSFSAKSDGFYMYNSGQLDNNFYTQPQHSFHGMGNSYGSQRGNMYYQGGGPESTAIGGAKSHFTYEELMEITNGFSRQNIIGEGGFGCVYKGWLPDGRIVAVKQLKKGSGQGEREFQAEVEIISRVHHRYLVSLVGYCICESQRLLIYEFVPNQTLEHHLHGMPVLEWPKRMKIALGAARGLAYLHEDCHPKIIHRDIKSANILLDDAFEAQVADFGLAKLTDDTNTHVSTRVMGTFGYMAPEYASSGKLTDRSDVFSFGVVLLELITGRKPVDSTQPLGDESLVEWARPHLNRALDTGDFGELVDPRLEKHYVESEMFRMIEAAAACVRHSAPKRPRMKQVARALDCEEEASDLSNGVKYGQSTVYESGQYNQDITRFRKMAFGSGGSKDFELYSGDYTSREQTPPGGFAANSWKSGENSSNFTSGESETQAMNMNMNMNMNAPHHHGYGARRL